MKKKLTEILIVEDEPLIAEDISGTLREAGHGIAGVAHNAEKALEFLKTKSPVLVLLDIKIDGPTDGLKLARIIKDQFQIPFIFLTSYTDEPTLEAVKELKPHGFIVKPFDDKELITNVELAIDKFKERSEQEAQFARVENPSSQYFFLKQNGVMLKIDFCNVLYAQALDNYCFLFTKNKKYLVPHTLKWLEENLDRKTFFRTYRSYLVNIHAIDSIYDDYVMVGETSLTLSKNARKKLLEKISFI